MLPKIQFSKPMFSHPAVSTKLDRPHCKQFRETTRFAHIKFLRVRRGCQASQRQGLTSGEVRETSGEVWDTLNVHGEREVPGKSPKTSGEVWGISGEVRGLSRSAGPRARAPECPKSVPRVSRECPQSVLRHLLDAPETLSEHFLDTPEPGARIQATRQFCLQVCELPTYLGIVQKVFSEKASAIARMRQKCIRNASKMRQNGSCFIGKRGTSKMRQKSVKIASKMRGTPLEENTFWTIPTIVCLAVEF